MIVYKSLPHYRVDFYELLRLRLSDAGVNLRLIVGQPIGAEAEKNDVGHVQWEELVRNRSVSFRGRVAIWQPVLGRLRSADLVIVEQANKVLVNHILVVWRRFRGPRLAFWGHGYNRDSATASRVSEGLKRLLVRQCDWWFGYTRSTAAYLVSAGVDPTRITTVQNAIDTKALVAARQSLPEAAAVEVLRDLGVVSSNVATFVGSLYEAKRLRFLVEACDLVRTQVPDFCLLVVGDGPQRSVIEEARLVRPWLVWVGAAKQADLVRLTSPARVMLMPGLVGLVILDSFALELPIITTGVDNHSPEIDYLVPEVNGVMLAGASSASDYARAVVALLCDSERLGALRAGCAESAQRVTVEAMAENFARGVIECLGERVPACH